MHISNSFVVVCNIQIVIRILYYSFEMLLLLSFFYLMVKPGKSFVKIRSSFQIALFFLVHRNFQPPSTYLIINSYFCLLLTFSKLLNLPLSRHSTMKTPDECVKSAQS